MEENEEKEELIQETPVAEEPVAEEPVAEVVNESKVDDYAGPTQSNGNGMATASLVLGLVGLFLFALPCGTLAVIFSIISKKKAKSGKATAGLVLGIIDLASWVLLMILGATIRSSLKLF